MPQNQKNERQLWFSLQKLPLFQNTKFLAYCLRLNWVEYSIQIQKKNEKFEFQMPFPCSSLAYFIQRWNIDMPDWLQFEIGLDLTRIQFWAYQLIEYLVQFIIDNFHKSKNMHSNILTNLLQILSLTSIIPTIFSLNLICNGDFQGRNLPFTYLGEHYNFFSSNYSCWFNKNGGDIKLKHKLYPPVTTAAQLFIFSQYVLCQNVRMEVGKQYELNFSLANSVSMSYARILAKINDVEIMNLTSLGQYNVANASKIITANATINKLCFQPNFVIDDPIRYPLLGPCIDNVSIVAIVLPVPPATTINTTTNTSTNTSVNTSSSIPINATTNTTTPISINVTQTQANTSNTTNTTMLTDPTNTTFPTSSTNSTSINSTDPYMQPGAGSQILFEIYCRTNLDEDSSFFTLSCTYQKGELSYLITSVKSIAQVFIDGELQKNAEFTDITLSSMKIIIRPNREYLLRQISVAIPDDLATLSLGVGCKFRFFVDGENVDLELLNNEEKKIIQSIYPVTETAIKLLQQVYSVLRASFFSYFLLDIISFWNLSLMYNFLSISTVPLFSKYFLQKLERVLFKLNNIIEWVSKMFPQLKSTFDFSNTGGREQMEEYMNNFAWFGAFGASSKYLSNNVQQIFVIGLLLLKLGLITLLKKISCVPLLIRNQLPDGLKKFKIFLNELVGIQIFMVVSASKAIQNLGMEQSQEKVNGFLQVWTLFLCIIVLPLNLITQGSIWQKKVQKKLQKKCETIRSIPTLTKIQARLTVRKSNKILASIYHVLQFLPFVVIPFLITFNNPQLFLAFNTAILAYRSWFLCRYLKVFQFRLSERVFVILNLGIWVVHHSMYLVFWVLERIKQDSGRNDSVMLDCVKVCGFVTIFTVVLGGVFQLLKFCLQILSFMLKQVRKILKKCRKHKHSQITPQPQNPNPNPIPRDPKIRSSPNTTTTAITPTNIPTTNNPITTAPSTKTKTCMKTTKSVKKVKLIVEIFNEVSIVEGDSNQTHVNVVSRFDMNQTKHHGKYTNGSYNQGQQNLTKTTYSIKHKTKPKQQTSQMLRFLKTETTIPQTPNHNNNHNCNTIIKQSKK